MLQRQELDEKFLASLSIPALIQAAETRRTAQDHLNSGEQALQSELQHIQKRAFFYRGLLEQYEVHSRFIEQILATHRECVKANTMQYDLFQRFLEETSPHVDLPSSSDDDALGHCSDEDSAALEHVTPRSKILEIDQESYEHQAPHIEHGVHN